MIEPVKEGSSATVRFKVYESAADRDAGNPMPIGSLDTLSVTLYDEQTGTIINDREDVDSKDANWGTFDTDTDEAVLEFEPADNPIVTASEELERHVLEITATYTAASGQRTVKDEIIFTVENLTKTT